MTQRSPFCYFKTRLDIFRLAVMLYIRFLPLLRKVEDKLQGLRIEIRQETVRDCWKRFGQMFAAERQCQRKLA